MHDIRHAHFPRDQVSVVGIFREYVTSPTIDLGFQDYEQEFATLPGAYALPDGCLLLAWYNGAVVGCAALRRVDALSAEMKRVYLRPVVPSPPVSFNPVPGTQFLALALSESLGSRSPAGPAAG
ncbi:GNAT family N-acetyltransferase [Hydrogenophaga sp.]|uniref:GNAT family N-acetyltransferase n=1 Tax=Hydrogenophaga sp. TaxID=1904254 RepID=UPI0035B1B0BE